jgi:hypothetical protein
MAELGRGTWKGRRGERTVGIYHSTSYIHTWRWPTHSLRFSASNHWVSLYLQLIMWEYLRLLIWRPSFSPSPLLSPHKIMFSAQAYSFPKEQTNIQASLYLRARKTSFGGGEKIWDQLVLLTPAQSLISSPLRWLPKSRAWCIGGFGSWTKACRKSSVKTSYPFRLCLLTQHREPAKRGTRGPKP